LQAGNLAQHFELLRSVEAFNGQVAGELRREIDRLEANLHYQKAQALREHREKFIKATLDFIQFRREHTAGLANKSYNIYRDAEGDIQVAPMVKEVFDANGRSLFSDLQQRLDALRNERDEDVVIETRAKLLTRLRQVLRTTRDIALTRQIARYLADQDLAADAKGMLLADLEAAIAKFSDGIALIDEQIRRLETQLTAVTDAAQRQAIEQALAELRTAKGELAGVQQTFNGLS
jgi:hypothetical protein